ncbi:MAG: class I SAM-dependent methyltransferase [bacterium]|nr:class I SAM-dependent methyltransferase [bacterium]
MSHVCSHKLSGILDSPLRRYFQNPEKILGKYVGAGMKVLDIGCGTGFTTIPLARMVGVTGSVTAVDVQQEMLDKLKKHADKAGVGDILKYHKSDGESLGVKGEFDLAVAFYVVHEIPSTAMLLSEVYSLLKPKGLIYIAEPSFHVPFSDFEKMLKTAIEIGYKAKESPVLAFSHVVLLEKLY